MSWADDELELDQELQEKVQKAEKELELQFGQTFTVLIALCHVVVIGFLFTWLVTEENKPEWLPRAQRPNVLRGPNSLARLILALTISGLFLWTALRWRGTL